MLTNKRCTLLFFAYVTPCAVLVVTCCWRQEEMSKKRTDSKVTLKVSSVQLYMTDTWIVVIYSSFQEPCYINISQSFLVLHFPSQLSLTPCFLSIALILFLCKKMSAQTGTKWRRRSDGGRKWVNKTDTMTLQHPLKKNKKKTERRKVELHGFEYWPRQDQAMGNSDTSPEYDSPVDKP